MPLPLKKNRYFGYIRNTDLFYILHLLVSHSAYLFDALNDITLACQKLDIDVEDVISFDECMTTEEEITEAYALLPKQENVESDEEEESFFPRDRNVRILSFQSIMPEKSK